jgi:hypothetical protein
MHGSISKVHSKNLVHIYTLNFWLYKELHIYIYDISRLRVKASNLYCIVTCHYCAIYFSLERVKCKVCSKYNLSRKSF